MEKSHGWLASLSLLGVGRGVGLARQGPIKFRRALARYRHSHQPILQRRWWSEEPRADCGAEPAVTLWCQFAL